ncbi:preprotein translocase subunit SecE [Mycolicibacter icosiumassiliensis]|uniref:preprotein translocase subunit SecE n=1 Tax=Mycolicibacter icosiumassiliensis TaxID=1792835 RepID=UPI00082B362E|nr:preprotein translocase subunit SecE [Mycolicibacter icosiumassiliensis]
MTDELDRPDAAADGDSDAESGSSSRTAVVSRQVGDPLRPTGKRSRRRDAGDGADDVESTATELDAEDAADAAKAKKKAKKKAEGPSRNPLVFVLNFLKQVVGELRKVIWPNRKQMVTYTAVVLAFLVFMVALVTGADYGWARLVLLVFGE